MARIHPRDRGLAQSTWERLLAGEKTVSCDYRFVSPERREELWLRDVSVRHLDAKGSVKFVTSSYTDISDLKPKRAGDSRQRGARPVAEIIEGFVHDIQNNLQAIIMQLHFLRESREIARELDPIVNGVDQVCRSTLEFREYFSPPTARLVPENPDVVLQDCVQELEKDFRRQRIQLRLIRRSPLPRVSLNLHQFRSALQRVLSFSRALLPQGGELTVEAGLTEVRGEKLVEFKVISSSQTDLKVPETNVFRPFLQVNGHQMGLSLALARQILSRHDGKIFFKKETGNRGLFTIRLKVTLSFCNEAIKTSASEDRRRSRDF